LDRKESLIEKLDRKESVIEKLDLSDFFS
jgi:hypothetical protein